MKQFLIILSLFMSFSTIAQKNIFGSWSGTMKTMQGSELIFVMKINKQKKNPIQFYCPTLGIKNIEITDLKVKRDSIWFFIPEMNAKMMGNILNDSTIESVFDQGIIKNPITFNKKDNVPEVNRPQEPTPPFNYIVQEVEFKNTKEGISLKGTLTIPKDNHNAPCVVLISGSGQQNRDEEIMGHKPFLVISDYLTQRGIAVFRYDDRGAGESEGNPANSTSADFAEDTKAAVEFLKNHKGIDNSRIGLMGHSEGGLIAGMVAANNPDIAYIIGLAGPFVPGDIILLEQTNLIFKQNGVSDNLISKYLKTAKKVYQSIKKIEDQKKLLKKVKKQYLKFTKKLSDSEKEQIGLTDIGVSVAIQQVLSPWLQFFIKYNPIEDYKNVNCPILALNGSKDVQVPAKINTEALINFSLKNKKPVEIKIFDGLNHLFQSCKTCEILEYGLLEETFNEDVLKYISDWITIQNKK